MNAVASLVLGLGLLASGAKVDELDQFRTDRVKAEESAQELTEDGKFAEAARALREFNATHDKLAGDEAVSSRKDLAAEAGELEGLAGLEAKPSDPKALKGLIRGLLSPKSSELKRVKSRDAQAFRALAALRKVDPATGAFFGRKLQVSAETKGWPEASTTLLVDGTISRLKALGLQAGRAEAPDALVVQASDCQAVSGSLSGMSIQGCNITAAGRWTAKGSVVLSNLNFSIAPRSVGGPVQLDGHVADLLAQQAQRVVLLRWLEEHP